MNTAHIKREFPGLYAAGLIRVVGRPATADEINGKILTDEKRRKHSERAGRYYHEKVKGRKL